MVAIKRKIWNLLSERCLKFTTNLTSFETLKSAELDKNSAGCLGMRGTYWFYWVFIERNS